MNKLIHGDCLEVMKNIPDGSVDMILCDLPYGTTDKNNWDTLINNGKLFEQYNRLITDNGIILLYSQQPFSCDLITAYRKHFRYEIIWEKTKPVGFFNAKKMPMRNHENILVFYKKLPTYNPELKDCEKKVKRPNDSGVYGTRRSRSNEYTMMKTGYPRTVVKFSNVMKPQLHPTQKPIDLTEYLIKMYSNECDTVLDNCMGSGTTGVVCKNTNRNFIGIELDKDYFEIAEARITQAEKDISEK